MSSYFIHLPLGLISFVLDSAVAEIQKRNIWRFFPIYHKFMRGTLMIINFEILSIFALNYTVNIFWMDFNLESNLNSTHKSAYWEQNGLDFGLDSANVIFSHLQSIIFSSGSRISDGLKLRRIWLGSNHNILTVYWTKLPPDYYDNICSKFPFLTRGILLFLDLKIAKCRTILRRRILHRIQKKFP
jgi:hypothetical protein